MQNKLRIEKKDIYQIEVNDKGEYIEFDLADINLSFKCMEALESIEKLKKESLMKENIIKKKQDVKDKYMTRNQKELLKLWKKTFEDMRKAMDKFLGEGACQKIFGDRNYLEMFDDLVQELKRPREELGGKSHFDNLNLTFEGMRDRIAKKYDNMKDKEGVI